MERMPNRPTLLVQYPRRPSPRHEIAGRVRDECQARGVGAAELGIVIGRSYSTALRSWRGRREYTVRELVAVADWLQVTPARLLPGDPRMTHDEAIRLAALALLDARDEIERAGAPEDS